jgi:small-conductance mechanosensitive channel
MQEIRRWLVDLSGALSVELWSAHGSPITIGGIALLLLSLLVAIVLGRFIRVFVVRVLQNGTLHADPGTAYALARIAQYCVTAVGILFGLDNAGISIGTLAALGAVFAVGFGVGVQSIAQNFVSGLILLIERPIKKGNLVRVGGMLGVVDGIAIRATRIITADGVAVILPNSKVIAESVENWSEPVPRRRFRIDVRVTHGCDARKVEQRLRECADNHPSILHDPAPTALLESITDDLGFALYFWLADMTESGRVSSELRHQALELLAQDEVRLSQPLQSPIAQRPSPNG